MTCTVLPALPEKGQSVRSSDCFLSASSNHDDESLSEFRMMPGQTSFCVMCFKSVFELWSYLPHGALVPPHPLLNLGSSLGLGAAVTC